jgi:hypothetical protein
MQTSMPDPVASRRRLLVEPGGSPERSAVPERWPDPTDIDDFVPSGQQNGTGPVLHHRPSHPIINQPKTVALLRAHVLRELTTMAKCNHMNGAPQPAVTDRIVVVGGSSPSACEKCREVRNVEDARPAEVIASDLDLASIRRFLIPDLSTPCRQLGSHRPDAVFVITNRDIDQWRPGLVDARSLAERWDIPLILIRSGSIVHRPIREMDIPDTSSGLVVLDLTRKAYKALARSMPRLASDGHEVTTRHRPRVDTPLKRNLVEILAVLAGFREIIVMDDDVTDLPPERVPGTQGKVRRLNDDLALRVEHGLAEFAADARLRAVLYAAVDEPDHSVVGSARHRLGRSDGVFVGGGFVLQRVGGQASFHPDIYNEDWFALIGRMLTDGAGHPSTRFRYAGPIFQAPRRRTATSRRARSEEIGDLAGEAVLPLLARLSPGHVRELVSGEEFWKEAIRQRRRLLRELIEASGPDLDPDRRALRAARDVYRGWDRDDLARQMGAWVDAWDQDLETWAAFSGGIEQSAPGDFDLGITVMGLHPFTRRFRRRRWHLELAFSA